MNQSVARNSMSPTRWLVGPLLLLMALGYFLPGLILFILSITTTNKITLNFSEYSIFNYLRIASTSYYSWIIIYTLLLSVAVALITAVLAYPVAYYLARTKTRTSRIYFVLTFTPLAVGMNMLTMGWMVLLGRNGLINETLIGLGIITEPLPLIYNWFSVVVGLVHVTFTFMVLPIEAVLRDIDPAIERAARNLGAGPIRAFFLVTFPLSIEGISAGFLIVFMQTCGAFVLPLLLGGPGLPVLPVSIWEQMTTAGDRGFASVLAIILLAISAVVLSVQLRYFRTKR